jgi:hypothetical protein
MVDEKEWLIPDLCMLGVDVENDFECRLVNCRCMRFLQGEMTANLMTISSAN